MTIRIKWNTVPGDSDFAYANVNGVRVAHIVRHNGEWVVYVTKPKLKCGGTHATAAKAKTRVRELLSQEGN